MDAELENEIEDGEIDDSNSEGGLDDVYVPLERPLLPKTAQKPPPPPEDVSDHEAASSDSSDSDGATEPGRKNNARLKPRVARPVLAPAKKKKYMIWCADATEDNLADNMGNINVDRTQTKSRAVETYNHLLALSDERQLRQQVRPFPAKFADRLGNRAQGNHDGASNKRDSSGRPKAKARKGRNDAKVAVPESSAPREILPLVKCETDSEAELAKNIANNLLEEKEDVILNVIRALGKERAVQLFEETVQVEKNGGLLIMNGSRRRTPGGVYFYLLKTGDEVTPAQIQAIFGEDRRQVARNIKKLKAVKRKEALSQEFTVLLTETGAAISKKKAEEVDEDHDSEVVKNPPPSPATDGRDSDPDLHHNVPAPTTMDT